MSELEAILYASFLMPSSDVKNLFEKIDTNNDNKITFGKDFIFILIHFNSNLIFLKNFKTNSNHIPNTGPNIRKYF